MLSWLSTARCEFLGGFMNRGFSLIELAAVILIIALLLAGISAGSSLIKQSEMQAVISDFQTFRKSYYDFTTRYRQIPGDMANAATYWSSGCTVTITCNGDGDARVESVWNSNTDETARAMKHLSLAELIPHGINTIPASYVGVISVGDLAPASKITGAGYFISSGTDIGGDAAGSIIASPWSSDTLINSVFLGRKTGSATSNGLTNGSVNASYAYNIDKKIDDGKTDTSGNSIGFNTGKIRARNDGTGATTCINAGATAYVVTSKEETCLVGYQLNDR